MPKKENIVNVNLTEEMETAYGDYALAVLVGRAIPALQDGLKPVTRRILTVMKWLNLNPEGRYMKSARVEGEVMGKLSPHGGSYTSMVTVATPHSNNHPMISGWGNWGSSTDGPAASRYTECKLSSLSWEVLLDDTDIWETRDNYDGSLQEPVLLEAKIPVGLLNGASGIGVGFATNIPPHNLRGICRAVKDVISGDGKSAAKNLIPDFPTGCDVVKNDGLVSYLETGRGSLRLRAKMTEEDGQRKKKILTFTCLPYGTNPEKVGLQVKKALDDGKIVGVTSLSDLSDRSGDCLQVTVKENFDPEELYRFSDLESTFACNSLWIDGVKPVELSPISVVREWYDWRMTRLVVKFSSEKEKLEARNHLLEGLLKALSKIDTVIKLIRSSENKEGARVKLMGKPLSLTETQANFVLEMRLRQLTSMDVSELESELASNLLRISDLSRLIEDEGSRTVYLLEEVNEIGKRHGNARRSSLIEAPAALEVKGPAKVARVSSTSMTRYVKVNYEKGILEQLKKPRGSDIVVDNKDKIIALSSNGTFKRLPAKFSGPVFDEPVPLLMARKASDDVSHLVVFSLDGEVRKMTIPHSELSKTTSVGKALLPSGSSLMYFGTKPVTLKKVGRGKDIVLSPKDVKVGKPGQKGIKVSNIGAYTMGK